MYKIDNTLYLPIYLSSLSAIHEFRETHSPNSQPHKSREADKATRRKSKAKS